MSQKKNYKFSFRKLLFILTTLLLGSCNLTNKIDNKPLAISLSSNRVLEGLPGESVGVLSTVSMSGKEQYTYQIKGKHADYFVIDGNELKLKPDVKTDFEQLNQLEIMLISTSSSGKKTEQKHTIKVDDGI